MTSLEQKMKGYSLIVMCLCTQLTSAHVLQVFPFYFLFFGQLDINLSYLERGTSVEKMLPFRLPIGKNVVDFLD